MTITTEEIRAIAEAQKIAKRRRAIEQIAAASPTIVRARQDERTLDTIFGAKR